MAALFPVRHIGCLLSGGLASDVVRHGLGAPRHPARARLKKHSSVHSSGGSGEGEAGGGGVGGVGGGDGGASLSRRERPHLAVDTNGIVRAITNGATPVWPCSEPNVCPDDYCFTSLELVGARD